MDANQGVSELSECNNEGFYPDAYIAVGVLPDLFVADPASTTLPSGAVLQGTPFTINGSLSNYSLEDSDFFLYRFYLSEDEQLDRDTDIELFTYASSGLDALETENYSWSSHIPPGRS